MSFFKKKTDDVSLDFLESDHHSGSGKFEFDFLFLF